MPANSALDAVTNALNVGADSSARTMLEELAAQGYRLVRLPDEAFPGDDGVWWYRDESGTTHPIYIEQ